MIFRIVITIMKIYLEGLEGTDMAINAIGGLNSAAIGYDRQAAEAVQATGIVTQQGEQVTTDNGADEDAELIGISADGDTAKASAEAISNLKEGFVFNKTENKAVNTDESSEDNIGSLNGFSSNQLETMYRQGRISRHDYDMEIDRRDRITEKDSVKTEADKKAVKEATVATDSPVKGSDDAENAVKEDKIQSKTGNDTVDSSTQSESAKTLITEETEQYDEFLADMNSLAGQKEDISLREQNMQAAMENDRMDIMSQIYNGDAGMKVQIN